MAAPTEHRCLSVVALAVTASLLVPSSAIAGSHAPLPCFAGPPAAEVPADDVPDAGDASDAEPSDDVQPTVDEPTVETVEREPAPSGGGVAGAIVDPDDPNATRAQSDLEGESLDTNVEGVPERLPKLQAAGWWMTFTAVALATSGGIFAAVAETRQDQAERLAYGFDLETGRASLYGPIADEYEQTLREGNNYQWVARGLIIAGGVALIAGIGIFAADGAKRRRAARGSARLQLDPSPTGLRLRF